MDTRIQDAVNKLNILKRLPRKSDIDLQMIEDLENYIADLIDRGAEREREKQFDDAEVHN